jgi:hypothetical protein
MRRAGVRWAIIGLALAGAAGAATGPAQAGAVGHLSAASAGLRAGTETAPPEIPTELLARVEALIEQELQRRVAPADRWEVHLEASLEELKAGRLPSVEAHAFNIRLPEGEVIAEADLKVSEVQLNLAADAVTATGVIDFLLRLRPEDIAHATQLWSGGRLSRVRLRIKGENVFVNHARLRAFGLHLPLARRGHPGLHSNAIFDHAVRVVVAGIPIPLRFMRKLERRINPILDPAQLPVPVVIETFGVEDGLLTVRIHAEPSGELPPPPVETLVERLRRRRQRHAHSLPQR